ncbi:hypothetical protein [Anaeroselena agilis]|uniref:Phage protein n=1 Tax=Anaeroselena agilis TaxID=3063788 RepID=A0ABU3NWE8_9FIRM|nr:hypothetical protein [Selenomonadales bacterium 4137-cl]
MTIEQLSEKIMALAAECEALTGSASIVTDSTTGPYVQMFSSRAACVDTFVGIDAPMNVEQHSENYYKASKTIGGVEYFMIFQADELGLPQADATEAVSRYFEGKGGKAA